MACQTRFSLKGDGGEKATMRGKQRISSISSAKSSAVSLNSTPRVLSTLVKDTKSSSCGSRIACVTT